MDFLFENKLRDSREWHREHRDEYERYVKQPLLELAAALGPAMADIDPLIITEPKRIISRIFRDTRFTHDKSLFRDSFWLSFERDKKDYRGAPGFFFGASPRGWDCGVGYYQAPPEGMEELRRMVLDGDRVFNAMVKAYKKQDLFRLDGERYKRSKFPDAAPELRLWLDLKSACFIHSSCDEALLYSGDELVSFLSDGFRRLKPMYDFFLTADSAVRKRQQISRVSGE